MTVLALVAAAPLQAADAPALVTIVEGAGLVIEGARSVAAAPGLKLNAATIIDTTPATALLRIEFADGSLLDLGPDTRVMLQPPGLAGGGPRGPAYYLLQGWAKHTSGGGGKAGGQLAFAAEVQQPSGVTVSRVSGEALQLFVETGALQLQERRIKPASALALKAGEFYQRDGADKGQVSPRPAPGFLQSVPKGFRDTIPPRAAQLKGRPPEPQTQPWPGYAALKAWLSAEPVIRREFPRRFAVPARDAAFRDGLVKNLASHPEWEPVLFPPKPASAPSSPSSRP
ncbi:hypothetical protein HLB44_13960 [Aquincola sp. S2]|uniref:FecR protein domain-containing protein n=1 Tax=Pseudaquabacterium terrae TaxID=2732868 RepID=A0ABX2EHK1_9BURK|nr:hypothetical protein [Aquabacterium terrae]NRF68093.1 hypothetical protein [Aquabacterium terrae]